MKKIALVVLRGYKLFVSPYVRQLFRGGCRFSPTCSEYAYGAIEKFGFIKGGKMALGRIARCHPGTKPAFDPV